MVWAIIIIVLLASADQLLKLLIKTNLSTGDSIPVIENFFYIVNRRNTGAAWSFLAGKDWGIYVLAAVSAVVTALMVIMILRSRNTRLQACLTIISAGSLGNLIDRIRDLAVTDYLDFHFGSYIFPTFNLADMLIVCGTILLAILILFDHSILAETDALKKEKPNESDPAH